MGNNKREQAMESLRTDARGSVRAESDFQRQMAAENARHREHIAYLSAIEHNTGQYVSEMSTAYKQLTNEMWKQSMPAMFGVPSFPGNNYASRQNTPPPVVFTDDKIIGALQLIVRNTNGMRNFNGVPRYA